LISFLAYFITGILQREKLKKSSKKILSNYTELEFKKSNLKRFSDIYKVKIDNSERILYLIELRYE